jgi:hypothetical protein
MSTKSLSALGAGLVGAASLNLVHEAIRRVEPNAPRMELLGKSALVKILRNWDIQPPRKDNRYGWTMAGDLLSNTLYYSLAGIGKTKHAWIRGAALGFTAGLGAVFLPKPLGLPSSPSNRTLQTQIMTVAYYTFGGLVTAATLQWLEGRRKQETA